MIIRTEKETEIRTQELLVLVLLVQGETQKSTFKVRFSSICFAFTKGWSCNNFFYSQSFPHLSENVGQPEK